MRRVLAAIGAASLVAVSSFVLMSPGGTASAEPLAADVKPDVVMKAGDTWVHHSKDIQVEDPVLTGTPTGCRELPDSATCDVFRVKFKRDASPDAINFASFTLDYKPVAEVPDLSLVATGLKSIAVGQLNVQVFDKEDHYLGQNYPGQSDISFVLSLLGQTPVGSTIMPIVRPPVEQVDSLLFGGGDGDPNDTPPGGTGPGEIPARGGFDVKQDVYDLKVYLSSLVPGFNTEYTLTLKFTNGKFDKPNEVLDPNSTAEPTDGFTPPAEFSPSSPADTSGNSSGSPLAGLPDANLSPDSDIAGIGLGVNEQFGAPPAAALGSARNVGTTAKSPSGIAPLIGLGVLPVGAGLAGIVVMRRRRDSFAI